MIQTERETSQKSYGKAFRSAYSVVVFGMLGLIAFIGGCVIVAAASQRAVIFIGLVPLPLAGAALLVRCVRVRLRIEGDRIELRNVFSTRRVSASEIRQIGWKNFNMPYQYGSAQIPALGIQRSHGKTLISTAVIGCSKRQIDELLDSVHRFAADHALRVSLDCDDLYLWRWSWTKVTRSPELP